MPPDVDDLPFPLDAHRLAAPVESGVVVLLGSGEVDHGAAATLDAAMALVDGFEIDCELGIAALSSNWKFITTCDRRRKNGLTSEDRPACGSLGVVLGEGGSDEGGDDAPDLLAGWSIGPGRFAAEIAVVSHQPKEPSVYKEPFAGLGLAPVTIEVHRCPRQSMSVRRQSMRG